ncbi:MAG: RHS repeat-associated core domain-containing protein [Pseudomonas sp.]
MEAFKPLQSIKCCALQRATPYCPYGYRKSEGHLTSWLGFNGEPQDQQSDYYMLGRGYRAYNPRLMRFHSPDSLSPFGKGGINSYAYCAGDPVNFADPSGHLTPQKRNSQRSRATSSRRPSLTSEFESRAQQQGTTGAADLIARALTLLQELRQRLQHRPPVAIDNAEATPYASMESLQSSENTSLTDLPSAMQQSVQTTTPNTTEVTDIRMQAHELRANSPSRRRASI